MLPGPNGHGLSFHWNSSRNKLLIGFLILLSVKKFCRQLKFNSSYYYHFCSEVLNRRYILRNSLPIKSMLHLIYKLFYINIKTIPDYLLSSNMLNFSFKNTTWVHHLNRVDYHFTQCATVYFLCIFDMIVWKPYTFTNWRIKYATKKRNENNI